MRLPRTPSCWRLLFFCLFYSFSLDKQSNKYSSVFLKVTPQRTKRAEERRREKEEERRERRENGERTKRGEERRDCVFLVFLNINSDYFRFETKKKTKFHTIHTPIAFVVNLVKIRDGSPLFSHLPLPVVMLRCGPNSSNLSDLLQWSRLPFGAHRKWLDQLTRSRSGLILSGLSRIPW